MRLYSSIKLAKLFHDTYETLAPNFGYTTREDTREFREDTPNGKLMIAVCQSILNDYTITKKDTLSNK